jgi:tRNA A-37 threonylcarbamoyl transferase component Bud32
VIGRTVGPYRILGPIGEGGMGAVYDAEDTVLGRRVALKFVPPELARDPQALSRFQREACALSMLDHPHVCRLFAIGEDEGRPYLAMERLDGRTLRSAIAGKPLPLHRVLELGAQLADALEAAHRKGIVHRDVKPSNVFLTKRGDAKLLDFGLAKIAEPPRVGKAGVDPDETTRSGEPEPLTHPGTAPGTAVYMSPEQARGEQVDARTDVFSLGAVLLEASTGRRFARGTALPADVPAVLAPVLAKALEDDPKLRYQSAAELGTDLLRARRELAGAATPGRPARRFAWAPVAVAGGFVLAAAAGAWVMRSFAPEAPPRFTQLTFRRGVVTSARFSPDGHTVVYSALWDGQPPEVFSRRLDSPASVSLGLPPSTLLSLSSKSELAVLVAPPGERGVLWVGTLARVPLSGGPLRPVLEDVLDADWSPDGRDLAAIRWRDGQFQLEYPLGHVLLRPCSATRLRVSPAGDEVALLDPQGILIVDLGGHGKRLRLWPAHQRLSWRPDGRSLLVDAGESDLRRTLWQVDEGGGVAEICALAGTLVVHDVSRDGRVLVHHGFERWSVRARAPGEADEHDASVYANSQVQGLSADGGRILLWDGGDGPPGSALLYPTRGGPPVRLGEGHPVGLSADGGWFLLQTTEGGRPRLTLTPTGPGEARPVPLGALDFSGLFFLDGSRLGFQGAEPRRPPRSFFADVSSGAVRPVTPEGTLALPGRLPTGDLLVRASTGTLSVQAASGGERRALPWTLPSDPFLETVGLTGDGRFLVVRQGSVPARLDRIEVASGRRTPWKTLRPPDMTGAGHIWTTLLTPDGEGYAYTHGLFLQDLFLVEGLR